MNGDRTAILGRIREALRVPAPRHHEKPPASTTPSVTAPFREWLPPVGPSHEDRVAVFALLSDALKTEFVDCDSLDAAAAHLTKLAAENGWKRMATHRGELCNALVARSTLECGDSSPLCGGGGLPPVAGPRGASSASQSGSELPHSKAPVALLVIDTDYDKNALEACDAGLTECECLVAQTGSVCVTTRSSGGRALSVLPPHHVVIARRAQLLPDLTAAYELLAQKYAASGYPSFMSFITGPSRTGDIERILVLGAHGPKKLTVLLVP